MAILRDSPARRAYRREVWFRDFLEYRRLVFLKLRLQLKRWTI